MNKGSDGKGDSKIAKTPEEQNQIRRAQKAKQKAGRPKVEFLVDSTKPVNTLQARKERAAEIVRLEQALKYAAEDRREPIQRVITKLRREQTRT